MNLKYFLIVSVFFTWCPGAVEQVQSVTALHPLRGWFAATAAVGAGEPVAGAVEAEREQRGDLGGVPARGLGGSFGVLDTALGGQRPKRIVRDLDPTSCVGGLSIAIKNLISQND